MEKSLVVTGRSLEEMLDKAAVLLHCSKETIAYEILREGLPATRSRDAVPWKIQATPVAPALEDTESETAARDDWDADHPLPAEWPDWVLLPHPDFLAKLTSSLTASPPSPAPPLGRAEFLRGLAPIRTIVGDFGRRQQTITHDGPLRIEGSVLRGAKVKAAGTLHITGDVETAFLEAGGSIVVDGGLLGTARSQSGDISCRFAQGARMTAMQGKVRVQESAMHSHLRAGQTVQVCGILLGGTAYGEQLVEAETAGSVSGVPTLLTAGRNARLNEEAEAMRVQATRIVARLSELNKIRRSLMARKDSLFASERAALWQTLVRTVRAHERLHDLAREKNQTLGMINAEHGSRICIEGRAYPKVRITVDDAVCELHALTQFATFSKDYDDGELRMTPLR